MKECLLTIKSHIALNETMYKMVLAGENLQMKAGQFVEVSVPNYFLRRPFSVASCTKDELTLIYKVVGSGTRDMAYMQIGTKLSVLCDLGNTFNLTKAKNPLLIGGGIGCAPMLQLAKEYNQLGITPTIILGFRNKSEMFCYDEFSALGEVIIATDDGSFGNKGNAVSVLKELNLSYDYYHACGPMVMLKALAGFSGKGELSLEARMGCGFGACMGCSIKTTSGYKRVCKEGPVFTATEVLFDE
ncbi:MAG: dihydroorotate dehydrogenase electron transfer subunit [Bacillota bacterium]